MTYDSVGQFFPWRQFASETLRTGTLPLWDPYQFCGTPFVANSQSAVLYPGNLLYVLFSPAHAAGWSVVLHLTLAALFMWLFLRGVGASHAAGVLGGIAFSFSTWQVAWLPLPTFLATSCWLPLALHWTRRLFEVHQKSGSFSEGADSNLPHALALGFVFGMALLAGHLQIAFYVLLATGMLAAGLVLVRGKDHGATFAMRSLLLFALSLVIGGILAAPQVLPALELSHRSHRAAPPSDAGYAAYTAYAVSPSALVTLFLPDFFGNPSRPETPYVGASRGGMYFNYAEGALYVGLPTLLLATYALLRRRRPRRLLLYLGVVALLSLLMAFGTAIDSLLYFHVPGFGQSGSPGRVLVLWAFAVSALAGLGYHGLTREKLSRWRPALLSVAVLAAAWAITYYVGMGTYSQNTTLPQQPWSLLLLRPAALFVLSAGVLLAMAGGRARPAWIAALPVALVTVDLFAGGINHNATSAPSEVYPSTPALAFLRANVGHDRIAPINTNWSFAGPRGAALPPNSGLALGLRDVQGYDSLFTGAYKTYMNRLAGPGRDASPPEVGNMVFAKDPTSPLIAQAGVRYVVSAAPLTLPGARETVLDNLYLYALPNAPGRAHAVTDAGRAVQVEWIEDGPTRVVLSADAPAPTTLTLADQRYPGWQATVDGRPVPILPQGDLFRAVRLPAGRHVVAFAYRPTAFLVGLYLMLIAFAFGGFGLMIRRGIAPRKDWLNLP